MSESGFHNLDWIDLDARDQDGNSALTLAVISNRPQALEAIANKALKGHRFLEIYLARNNAGDSAMQLACRQRQWECVRILERAKHQHRRDAWARNKAGLPNKSNSMFALRAGGAPNGSWSSNSATNSCDSESSSTTTTTITTTAAVPGQRAQSAQRQSGGGTALRGCSAVGQPVDILRRALLRQGRPHSTPARCMALWRNSPSSSEDRQPLPVGPPLETFDELDIQKGPPKRANPLVKMFRSRAKSAAFGAGGREERYGRVRRSGSGMH